MAAGAIAEHYLRLAHNVEIVAFVSSVGKVEVPTRDVKGKGKQEANGTADQTEESDDEELFSQEYLQLLDTVTRKQVDANTVRCPHSDAAKRMEERIIKAKEANDSIGGTVTCVIRNSPVGLGEPVFDKLEALLAHGMLSIPATKGFEIGSGFAGSALSGSKHNDPFVKKEGGGLGTLSNFSGGIQGGISNGEHIYFKCVVVLFNDMSRM